MSPPDYGPSELSSLDHVPPAASRMPTPWSRAAQQAALIQHAAHPPGHSAYQPGPVQSVAFQPGAAQDTSSFGPAAARFALLVDSQATSQSCFTPHQPHGRPSSYLSYPGSNTVPAGPPSIFMPNPYVAPGFTAVGSPTNAPTIVSSGLDLVSGTGSRSNGVMVRQPRVSKHAHGKDAVDVKKLMNIATQAPSSEFLMRYFTSANVHDPIPPIPPRLPNIITPITPWPWTCSWTAAMTTIQWPLLRCTNLLILTPRSSCRCPHVKTVVWRHQPSQAHQLPTQQEVSMQQLWCV